MNNDKFLHLFIGFVVGGFAFWLLWTTGFPKLLPYNELTCVVQKSEIVHCYPTEEAQSE